MPDTQTPAGWYPDPSGDATKLRYWDGTTWTEQTQDASSASQNTSVGQQPVQSDYQQASYQPQTLGVEDRSTTWLVIGIVSIFIMAWPIAVGQIIMATNAKAAYAAGNLALYNSKIKTAKTLLIVNIVVAVALWICCIAFGGLGYLAAISSGY
jgi:hypothetical protein